MSQPTESRSTQRRYTTPITSQLVDQRWEHQVTDEAAAVGRHSDRYQALCGQTFIAAPLIAPPGRPCPDCAAILSATSRPTAPAAVRQPRDRRHGLLRRLLHRE